MSEKESPEPEPTPALSTDGKTAEAMALERSAKRAAKPDEKTEKSAESARSGQYPDRRPPVALRLLVDHLWLVAAPLWFFLFLLIVHLTNPIDLTFLPLPRAFQAGTALLLLAVLLGGPYLLFRRTFDWVREDLLLFRDARMAVKEADRRLHRHGGQLKEEARKEVEAAIAALERSFKQPAAVPSLVADELTKLDRVLSAHLSFAKKDAVREYGESIFVAVLMALFLRAFVVEAFKIPSGSMLPTLEVGDHIFVNKFIYGIRIPYTNIKLKTHVREPRRGEVIVFVYPVDPEKDFIKRIVGIPGDTVQVCGGEVLVNGKAVRREPVIGPCAYDDYDEDRPIAIWHRVQCEGYREWNGNESYRTVHNHATAGRTESCTAVFTVMPDHVFVMGDNRDNSHDSRYWGQVPYDLIKGKAWFIWWSAGQRSTVRLNRMFNLIHH